MPARMPARDKDGLKYTHIHTRTHAHAYMHARTHTPRHTPHTHKHTHTYKHTRTHTRHMHALNMQYTITSECTHTHSPTDTNTQTDTHMRAHTSTPQACMQYTAHTHNTGCMQYTTHTHTTGLHAIHNTHSHHRLACNTRHTLTPASARTTPGYAISGVGVGGGERGRR